MGPKIVAVVDRWSLFRGYLCYESSKWDLKIVVVVGRWSLFGGGIQLRFDCIFKSGAVFIDSVKIILLLM